MKRSTTWLLVLALFALGAGMVGCSSDDDDDGMMSAQGLNPDTAPRASIDRFSSSAGHLFVRDGSNGLPTANQAIHMDQEPFITHGYGPQGMMVTYYNLDVMPLTPAPIYVLQREGESMPVAGQLNIVDVIPGDGGYNDFWRPVLVTVPGDYVANTIHNAQQIQEMALPMQELDVLVNCPIVPEGSTASLGGGANGLTRGWYRDQVVFYFNFDEAPLAPIANMVPTSPILVCFNINPDETGGGPASGFKAEPGTMQTHNVVATVPGGGGYSPLWAVSAYGNMEFENVSDWMTAAQAMPSWDLMATVNYPVVSN
ncbi:MAG: hypothetical protein H6505_02610 [Calditrichaeota bacterium]|nr:hypothetical protein [Calditrichota bacterium]